MSSHSVGEGGYPRVADALQDYPDKTLVDFYNRSRLVFDEITRRSLDRWVVTFSGGKDSTLTALLAVDHLSELRDPPDLHVVYSDTRIEIPSMRAAAEKVIGHIRSLAGSTSLPITMHVVRPSVENTFWVRMLGRGYPPPKPKFRWCTRRLKIEPASPYVASGLPTAVLTGVRYGESKDRTARLVASCATGGECGQDYWVRKGPKTSQVTYFAPIVHWTTCKVWDFLHFVAPMVGWPTQEIYALYGDSNLRFGCWTCTLVRRDKTVETLIERNPQSGLSLLHRFREEMWQESRDLKNREMRNGQPAALKVEFRSELLQRLLDVQSLVGLQLISEDEVATIRKMWVEPEARKEPMSLPSASSEIAGTTLQKAWM